MSIRCIAVLVMAASPLAHAAPDVGPGTGSGLVPPGEVTVLAHPDLPSDSLLWDEGTVDRDGVRLNVLREDVVGVILERGESWYSRNVDGDVLLHGSLNHLTGEERRYDPPLVMLDLPLEVGKTWRTKGVCSVTHPSGGPEENRAFDLVRTVDSLGEMDSRQGSVPAYLIVEEVGAGDPMGEMWYSPERGIMARRFAAVDEWQVFRESAEPGMHDLEGYGRPAHVRFNWPTDKTLRIDVTVSAEGPTGEYAVLSTRSYKVRVDADGDGRRIVIPWEVVAPLDSAMVAPAICDRWRGVRIAFRVDRDGKYLGVEDREGLHASYMSFMRDIRSSSPMATGSAWTDEAIQLAVTAEMLEQNLSAYWDHLVGWWCGTEAEIGKVMQIEAETPMVIVPGAKTRARRICAAVYYVRCNAEAVEKDCIVFSHSAHSRDPVAAALYLRMMEETTGLPAAGAGLLDVEVRHDVSTLVDPSTGMPKRVTQAHRVRGWDPTHNGELIHHTFEIEEMTVTLLGED